MPDERGSAPESAILQDRLDSWKEIAVSRPGHPHCSGGSVKKDSGPSAGSRKRGSIYARREELAACGRAGG
jgi:hypothetical protein